MDFQLTFIAKGGSIVEVLLGDKNKKIDVPRSGEYISNSKGVYKVCDVIRDSYGNDVKVIVSKLEDHQIQYKFKGIEL